MMVLLLLLLLLMMVMTVTVQGCTVVVVASGYRGVTLERNSVGNDGVATGGMTSTAQIYGVGVIVAVGGGQATAYYDIVVVLKASIVVVVVDYDTSVASGDTTADCAWIAGRVASGDYVMLRRMGRQMLLQNKLVGRLHRDC